jgi:hypothetical protein
MRQSLDPHLHQLQAMSVPLFKQIEVRSLDVHMRLMNNNWRRMYLMVKGLLWDAERSRPEFFDPSPSPQYQHGRALQNLAQLMLELKITRCQHNGPVRIRNHRPHFLGSGDTFAFGRPMGNNAFHGRESSWTNGGKSTHNVDRSWYRTF